MFLVIFNTSRRVNPPRLVSFIFNASRKVRPPRCVFLSFQCVEEGFTSSTCFFFLIQRIRSSLSYFLFFSTRQGGFAPPCHVSFSFQHVEEGSLLLGVFPFLFNTSRICSSSLCFFFFSIWRVGFIPPRHLLFTMYYI